MTRCLGLDLGLSTTGYAVIQAGPVVIARGTFRPPASAKDPQTKADIIADEVVRTARWLKVDRVAIEEPITNAWGADASGQRINRTNATSALAKGRLIGAVERALRDARVPYDEIGVRRWRHIVGVEATRKELVIVELRALLAKLGIAFTDGVRPDEIEAVGIGWAGVLAIQDPRVLLPTWKRPRPKKIKTRVREQGGLFGG